MANDNKKKSKKSEYNLAVRIPIELKEEFQAVVEARLQQQSNVIRYLMREYINRYKGDKK